MNKKGLNKKGFTLIELLVVIAIIGLLTTLAIVALDSARQKSRDAKRVTDIRQIQTALELYFNGGGTYPGLLVGPQSEVLGTAIKCIDGNGFNAAIGCSVNPLYMGQVPDEPTPTNSDSGGYVYWGRQATGDCVASADGDCEEYDINFYLEGNTGELEGPGPWGYWANNQGIRKCLVKDCSGATDGAFGGTPVAPTP